MTQKFQSRNILLLSLRRPALIFLLKYLFILTFLFVAILLIFYHLFLLLGFFLFFNADILWIFYLFHQIFVLQIHFVKFLSRYFINLTKLSQVHSDLNLKLWVNDGSSLLFISFLIYSPPFVQKFNFLNNLINLRLIGLHINLAEDIFSMQLNFWECSLFWFILLVM